MLLTLVLDFAQVTLPRWTPGRRDQTRLGDGFVKAASSTGSAATLVGQCEVGKKHEKIWENHGGATHFSQKNIAQRKIMHTVSKNGTWGESCCEHPRTTCQKITKPLVNVQVPIICNQSRHLQPSSQLQHLDSQSWASWPRHGNHDRGYPEEQQACWDHWHGLYEIFI